MNQQSLNPRTAVASLLLLGLLSTVAGAQGKQRIPSLDQIETMTEEFFARQPKYQPGEIISQSQVRALLEEFWRYGWKVPRQDELIRRVPDDSELFVRELRMKDGRKLSQQIARYPLGFDQLDRLSKMPTGKSILWRLVHQPDGYKLLQYLGEAPGGNQMGACSPRPPRGATSINPPGAFTQSRPWSSSSADCARRKASRPSARPKPRSGA